MLSREISLLQVELFSHKVFSLSHEVSSLLHEVFCLPREVFYLISWELRVGTGTGMMGLDIGISVGASVALIFGASAGVGVLCSMSFEGSCL